MSTGLEQHRSMSTVLEQRIPGNKLIFVLMQRKIWEFVEVAEAG